MRCLLVLMGLHALWSMWEAQEGGGAGAGGAAGVQTRRARLFLGGLCVMCLIFRSKETILYHGYGTRAYLQSKGLGVMDVGTALVVYEAMGFVLMCVFWGWCFALQPVKAGFLQPLANFLEGRHQGAVAGAKGYYEGVVAKAGDKFGWMAERFGLDPARLTTSFAEGAVCRSLLKPLLLPLKLYVAYTAVFMWKQNGGLICPWGAASLAASGAGGGVVGAPSPAPLAT